MSDDPQGIDPLAATAADSGVASPGVVRAASLERDPLKRDYRNFMLRMWADLFDGGRPTENMLELGHRLQFGPDRDICMGFRGMAKSYITVGFADWTLYCDPTEIVLTVSGSGDGAKGNAALAWSLINSFDWLSHMKPRGIQRSSSLAFDVAGSKGEKSESFAAMSLFGQLTGRRASLIIPDDVETPNTSATEGDRKELATRYSELGGAILKPGGRIKCLGTAQTEDTLYLDLAHNKGYGLLMIPVEYPSLTPDKDGKREIDKYGSFLSPRIRRAVEENPLLAGTSTEPTRFTEADLYSRKLEYGTSEYARQFKLWLDAGLGATRPLKWRDIPIIEWLKPSLTEPLAKFPRVYQWGPSPETLLPEFKDKVDSLNGDCNLYAPLGVEDWEVAETRKLIIDPSGEGEDETSWGMMLQHLGRIALVEAGARLEGFSDPTLDAIVETAVRWKPQEIIIEKNYGGGMFGALLAPKLQKAKVSCTITEEVAGGVQKEVRIVDSLETLITSHRLVIAAEVMRQDWDVDYSRIETAKRRNYRLSYQLSRITKSKGVLAHDDRVDMLASGAKSFQNVLKRILEEAAADSKKDYFNKLAEELVAARLKAGQAIFKDGKWVQPSPVQQLGGLIRQVGGIASSASFPGRHR